MRGTFTKHASQNFFREDKMKVAKKSKGVVSVNKAKTRHDEKKQKKESFISWFIRVTENHAQFMQAAKTIKAQHDILETSLQSLRRDGLIGEEAIDSLISDSASIVAKLDKYNTVLLKRRREVMVANVEAGKQKKNEENEHAEN